MDLFINEKFMYNGISSDYYDIYIVRVGGSNLIQGQSGINRAIIKDRIPNNPISCLFGIQEEPLTFKIQLFLDGVWTIDRQMEVIGWLFRNDYKPFYTYDNPEIVYYCMPMGNPSRYFNGIKEGYLELEFECNAPYPFTQVYQQTFDFSSNNGTQTFILTNHSNIIDYKHYPEIEFQLMGDSEGVSITNITDNGNTFSFEGLYVGETVYVDNTKKIIKSDQFNKFRYNEFNKKWFRLLYGENQIQITGKCILRVRSSFPIAI
jgi:phage-related protein